MRERDAVRMIKFKIEINFALLQMMFVIAYDSNVNAANSNTLLYVINI